jgi:UDP:flavonoid glycosyltransferase YjiC (YdhE family)
LKILIAPLDWGLGHTTRCIPLIAYLHSLGHQVFAAASGASARLLADNFPGLDILPLEGYRIRYSQHKNAFTARIIVQIPKILGAVRKEHRWLSKQQQIHKFDLIISDNRYGLYHDDVPSVIMTHQLQIQSGKGKFADAVLRKLHYPMLEKFKACWVVDEAGTDGLSGTLAHPAVLPGNATYIGFLSQFSGRESVIGVEAVQSEILILLSGPEPMRGQLETLLLHQAAALPQYHFSIVAGNPLGETRTGLPAHISYVTHMNAARLLNALQKATLVVCRSGYSTLMDLAVLGKKALLIPTPGQTEQEYLASHLQDLDYYAVREQEVVQLAADIPLALAAKGFKHSGNKTTMQTVVDMFLHNMHPVAVS